MDKKIFCLQETHCRCESADHTPRPKKNRKTFSAKGNKKGFLR